MRSFRAGRHKSRAAAPPPDRGASLPALASLVIGFLAYLSFSRLHGEAPAWERAFAPVDGGGAAPAGTPSAANETAAFEPLFASAAALLCRGGAPASAREAAWGYVGGGPPPGTVAQHLEHPLRLSVGGCGEAGAAFVRGCLRARHILFIGDSLSRYQYLSLAQFIAHESWTPFHGTGQPLTEVERVLGAAEPLSWGSWREFLAGTRQRLRPFEICDCFRDNNAPFMVENRFFFHPRANVRLSFVIFNRPNATRYHDLGFLNATCGAPGGCAQGGCAPEEDTCGDPSTSPQNHFSAADGAGAQAAFLRRLVVGSARELASRVAPIDALVLNLGYFGGAGWPRETQWEDPPASREVYKAALLDATRLLQKERLAAHLIWKATTASTDNDYSSEAELEWVRAELLPLGWQLFDAFHLTRELGEYLPLSVTDGIHFKPHVYRGLNEALALQLCGTPGAPFLKA